MTESGLQNRKGLYDMNIALIAHDAKKKLMQYDRKAGGGSDEFKHP